MEPPGHVYIGQNPILIKHADTIFGAEYENIISAKITDDAEEPNTPFSFDDFKGALIYIKTEMKDVTDKSLPFRAFWNTCRLGLPRNRTQKGYGRLMNDCFVATINKLSLPVVGEDTFPSRHSSYRIVKWIDTESDTEHAKVKGLGVCLNSNKKVQCYCFMLARRIRYDMAEGVWCAIMTKCCDLFNAAFTRQATCQAIVRAAQVLQMGMA
jgi:hypothetical protein